MSTINNILAQLETSEKPILKPLHKNNMFNVFVIGMKKDMTLSSHKAKWPSKLTIIEGSLNYIEGDQSFTLSKYDERDIQVNILHELEAKEDCICLLTQSKSE